MPGTSTSNVLSRKALLARAAVKRLFLRVGSNVPCQVLLFREVLRTPGADSLPLVDTSRVRHRSGLPNWVNTWKTLSLRKKSIDFPKLFARSTVEDRITENELLI
jgi:hypothetical protein